MRMGSTLPRSFYNLPRPGSAPVRERLRCSPRKSTSRLCPAPSTSGAFLLAITTERPQSLGRNHTTQEGIYAIRQTAAEPFNQNDITGGCPEHVGGTRVLGVGLIGRDLDHSRPFHLGDGRPLPGDDALALGYPRISVHEQYGLHFGTQGRKSDDHRRAWQQHTYPVRCKLTYYPSCLAIGNTEITYSHASNSYTLSGSNH